MQAPAGEGTAETNKQVPHPSAGIKTQSKALTPDMSSGGGKARAEQTFPGLSRSQNLEAEESTRLDSQGLLALLFHGSPSSLTGSGQVEACRRDADTHGTPRNTVAFQDLPSLPA